jgi:hypothetical protein
LGAFRGFLALYGYQALNFIDTSIILVRGSFSGVMYDDKKCDDTGEERVSKPRQKEKDLECDKWESS